MQVGQVLLWGGEAHPTLDSPTYYYHSLSTLPTLVCSNFYGPHDWFKLILSPDWNVPSFPETDSRGIRAF